MKRIPIVSAFIFTAAISFMPAYAKAYDLYVNSSSSVEDKDGSENKPFSKISDALDKVTSGQSIFIANGKYDEKIKIDKEISIVGQDESGTILNGNGEETGIEINANAKISNLTVQNFNRGIFVSKNAKADIEKIKVSNSKRTGIEIAESTQTDSKKVTVKNSTIEKNQKGFYILKRKIMLTSNDVISNREEGIDIRTGVKGTIKNNTVSKNKEGGIELVVGSTGLKILSNKISGNLASGIANQFYKGSKKLGSVDIQKNKIQNNGHFGILCDIPSGGKIPENYWKKSISLSSNNIFSGNKTKFAQRCGFSTAK